MKIFVNLGLFLMIYLINKNYDLWSIPKGRFFIDCFNI